MLLLQLLALVVLVLVVAVAVVLLLVWRGQRGPWNLPQRMRLLLLPVWRGQRGLLVMRLLLLRLPSLQEPRSLQLSPRCSWF